MPILINNAKKGGSVTTMNPAFKVQDNNTPKFFSKTLTGNGTASSRGLLSSVQNPINRATGKTYSPELVDPKKTTIVNGDITTTSVPCGFMDLGLADLVVKRKRYETPQSLKIGYIEDANGNVMADVEIDMTPHSFVMEKVIDRDEYNSASGNTTNFHVLYHVTLHTVFDATDEDEYNSKLNYTVIPQKWHNRNEFRYMNLVDVVGDLTPQNVLDQVNQMTIRPAKVVIDKVALNDWIENFSFYDSICSCAEDWNDNNIQLMSEALDSVAYYDKRQIMNVNDGQIRAMLGRQLKHLLDYEIPLKSYSAIYDKMVATLNTHVYSNTQNDAQVLAKSNLNLLLNSTLSALADKHDKLYTIPENPNAHASNFMNLEQRAAIEDHDPLKMIQAGAGTGKSTLVNEQIRYTMACGVDPKDITCISFTNAAADHIKELNQNVHAMTIGKMINDIYEKNYPKQKLSELDTLINTISIYRPSDTFAHEFQTQCIQLNHGDNNLKAQTSMNAFIEAHFDETIKLLNQIGQTSLELETIIAYQNIENMVEPDDVKSKFLIIDEVQDNSIFEFIFVLKYVSKHDESLFIVGDCSQTLYEFRSSNPKALNMLEGSGVFKTHKLQINYRSNQEILDFANQQLTQIEANQFANIQLKANSLAPVSLKSFVEKVRFHYEYIGNDGRIQSASKFDEGMHLVFDDVGYKYVDQCRKRKRANGKPEQVCILAYERRVANKAETLMREHYPDLSIVSLIPDKTKPIQLFSTYIRSFWDGTKFFPTQTPAGKQSSLVLQISDSIAKNYANLKVKPNMTQMMDRYLRDWTNSTEARAIDSWQSQYNAGITFANSDQLFANIQKSMLDYEINHNEIRQRVVSNRNADRKMADDVSNADILISTIHSAKGLEFDNTIVFYNQSKTTLPEDRKRMYYVAMTRAMNSELVIAYGHMMNPPIEADWKAVVKRLFNKEVDDGKLSINLKQVYDKISSNTDREMPKDWVKMMDSIKDKNIINASADAKKEEPSDSSESVAQSSDPSSDSQDDSAPASTGAPTPTA